MRRALASLCLFPLAGCITVPYIPPSHMWLQERSERLQLSGDWAELGTVADQPTLRARYHCAGAPKEGEWSLTPRGEQLPFMRSLFGPAEGHLGFGWLDPGQDWEQIPVLPDAGWDRLQLSLEDLAARVLEEGSLPSTCVVLPCYLVREGRVERLQVQRVVYELRDPSHPVWREPTSSGISLARSGP